jgi:hypothetical protein
MKSIDFIDKASYSGNVVLENFDLGTFRSEKSGKISMNIDVEGRGLLKNF